MKNNILNEIDISQGRKALDVLRLNTKIFENWNKRELTILSDHMKFLNFHKTTPLATKGEQVDYFGLILQGRAIISADNKGFGYLEFGDMIGYMFFSKLNGTKFHQFDVMGEKDGVIATIRVDDMKTFSKKEPFIALKFMEILVMKSYKTIYYQYRKEYPVNELLLVPSILPSKRISDMFDSIPQFDIFIKELEKRDKKFFLNTVSLYEFEESQVVIKGGSRANFVLFVIKGELIQFNDSVTPTVYKQGSIIGRREFFNQLTWSSNILGRISGMFVILTREMLQDIAMSNSQSAQNILAQVMKVEVLTIKSDYEQKFQDYINQNNIKVYIPDMEGQDRQQADNLSSRVPSEAQSKQVRFAEDSNKLSNQGLSKDAFIEIDVEKKIDQLSSQSQQDSKIKGLEQFKQDFQVAPLQVHDVFKKLIEDKNQSELKSKVTKRTDFGTSTFFKEKLTTQQQQIEKKKNDLKVMRKKGQISDEEYIARSKNLITQVQTEDKLDDYEDLKNQFILLECEKTELNSKIQILLEENKKLRLEINKHKDDEIYLQAKVNKGLVQKQIKQIGENNDTAQQFLKKKQADQSSFAQDNFTDILREQTKLNKRNKLVTKCALKWLRLTRQAILKRKIQSAK